MELTLSAKEPKQSAKELKQSVKELKQASSTQYSGTKPTKL